MRLRVTPLEHGRVGEMKQRSERPELPESPPHESLPPESPPPPTRVAASSSVANLPASQMPSPARLVIQMLYKCDRKVRNLHLQQNLFVTGQVYSIFACQACDLFRQFKNARMEQ